MFGRVRGVWDTAFGDINTFAFEHTVNLKKRDGFQLPHILGFYCPVFSALFRHERANKDLGLSFGELFFLWLVGLAIPLAHPVFDRA